MIRWFFYALVALFVSFISSRIYGKSVKGIEETSNAKGVILLFVCVVFIFSFYSSIVLFLIGLFKVLSNLKYW